MHKLLIILFLSMVILVLFQFIPGEDDRTALCKDITIVEKVQALTFPEPRKERVAIYPETVNQEENFTSSWTVNSDIGYIDGQFFFDHKHLDVYMDGDSLETSYLYHEGISLDQGTNYSLYFAINANIPRTIRVALKDTTTWSTIASSDYSINENTQNLSLDFTMNQPTTYQAALYFYIGNEGSHSNDLYHTIDIDAIRLVNTSGNKNSIRVNQVGYFLSEEKRCVFPYKQGDVFDVVRVEDNSVVYSGAVSNPLESMTSNEVTYVGDFSNVLTPGKYYIRSQFSETSYPFEIKDSTNYLSLQYSLLRMISLQRCGTNLDASWASDLSHPACHTSQATIYGTSEMKDVSGGWHDAGDYGRYVTTGCKSVLDLLMSYQVNPHYYGEYSTSADPSNGIPDILDEARYELEWLFKMQDTYGGVYSKVMTQQFPGSILPQNDNAPLYLMEVDTLATADFASAMALASEVYQDFDTDFSKRCLEASKNAFNFLLGNPEFIYHDNPEGFAGGDYRDESDIDERLNASLLLYTATLDPSYLTYAETYYQQDPTCIGDLSWKMISSFGIYHYLKLEEDTPFAQQLRQDFINQISSLSGYCYGDNYQAAIDTYVWGSNSYPANRGILFMMVYDLTQDPHFRKLGMEQVSYLCGKNALNMSFISGTGSTSP
ncbi:MAG: glycoside hydrolase family 9 protein, partial [Erysipelotrichaceae bacterium]|nr:glycoside hydrolase family 9 protein [Erysipelotrichaceae bacterium]